MKKYIGLLFGVTLFLSCKKTLETEVTIDQNPEIISEAKLDLEIRNQLNQNGNFNWNLQSPIFVWSALSQSDYILSVGYKPADEINIEDRLSEININSTKWIQAKNEVINIILEEERKLNKDIILEKIIPWQENVLPVINIEVKNLATIEKLRSSNLVRYAEPMGYEPKGDAQKILSSSGCSNDPSTGLIQNVDYSLISPNTKQSWNYAYHNIPNAWTKTTGSGVKVFIIDTGSEYDQENLSTSFNQGLSSGRSVQKLVTLPRPTFLWIPTGPAETPDDGCGHGTAMAGACAAPRGIDGASVGVAYNVNLITCRASSDVFIDESREAKGVSDAFTLAGGMADVKIISMSMGRITSSSQIKDAIKYAYGKGKLIFCAAGTSFGWTAGWYGVIFPATMTEVNAVTGVRDNSFTTTCTTCHDGSETDFTVVMEKGSSGTHPLTLAMSGDIPSTVGGSSVATATASGIAALVWSKFPSYTRDQILNKLIQTSANYPTRNSRLGWGNLNAGAATN